ncbi:BQ5605_C040g11880 [Microbotryum silenes-dioicae]|uniref:BQ5605_C040g11880 protein n=1 Tax=Microbotryum silenes-dioicae TaxID=796604 RepID=A0A2X0MQT8_9BASI|nr:BQ5605_C040g11880 [Microbotryum silenes-dioicae]
MGRSRDRAPISDLKFQIAPPIPNAFQDKSTPVTHPVPFITNDTLAAYVHGRSRS